MKKFYKNSLSSESGGVWPLLLEALTPRAESPPWIFTSRFHSSPFFFPSLLFLRWRPCRRLFLLFSMLLLSRLASCHLTVNMRTSAEPNSKQNDATNDEIKRL